MKKCFVCNIIALVAGIGALNWLLVALFNFNLVTAAAGDATTAAKVTYIIIGVAGLLLLGSLVKSCPCGNKTS